MRSWLNQTLTEVTMEKSVLPENLPSEFFAEDNSALVREIIQQHPTLIRGIDLDTPFLPKTLKMGETEYEVTLGATNNQNGKRSVKLEPKSPSGTSIFISQIDPDDNFRDGVMITTQTQYSLKDKGDSYVEKIQTFTSSEKHIEDWLALKIARTVVPIPEPISKTATHTEISVVKSTNQPHSGVHIGSGNLEDNVAIMAGGYSEQSGSITLVEFIQKSRKSGVRTFEEVPGQFHILDHPYWVTVAETYAKLLLNGQVEILDQPNEVVQSIT